MSLPNGYLENIDRWFIYSLQARHPRKNLSRKYWDYIAMDDYREIVNHITPAQRRRMHKRMMGRNDFSAGIIVLFETRR